MEMWGGSELVSVLVRTEHKTIVASTGEQMEFYLLLCVRAERKIKLTN